MQIELKLSGTGDTLLAFDYHHELSSAFYEALAHVFPQFANELHHGIHHSRIKLFVFSPFNSEPHPEIAELPGGAPALRFGSRIWLRFGSVWPEVIYRLAEALQKQHELTIRGEHFLLTAVEMVKTPDFAPVMTWRPFGQSGCIVCPYEKEGKTRYQMPDDSEKNIPPCADLVAGNLRHKLLRLREVRPDILENIMAIGNLSGDAVKELPIKVEFLPLMKERAYKTHLYRIKEVNIRGFRAPVRITAPEAVHRIVWDCGLGSLNSQGFGLVELGRK